MTRRRLLNAVLLGALVVGVTVPAAAQTTARQQASDLSRELMSPFCPGKLLADCTSSYAGELREAIATRLAGGEPVAAIKADLVRQYGKEILGAPPAEGVGLLAWLLPALLAVSSAVGVGLKVARAARETRAALQAAPAVAAAGGADAAVLARLDDELRDLD
ncbi:MAG: cytochrome c-type biogenesis protein CcmH [Vicinamibacterales bacterium]